MKNKIQTISITITCLLALIMLSSGIQQKKGGKMQQKYYYCEYCGHRFPSVRLLTSAPCVRHPDGPNKGRHKLYEGTEKSEYTCKYCGRKFPSIMLMTAAPCVNHPKGPNKGNHSPAL